MVKIDERFVAIVREAIEPANDPGSAWYSARKKIMDYVREQDYSPEELTLAWKHAFSYIHDKDRQLKLNV